ncbi:MAG: rhodanese-like domain-containing protein [Epsilonproteobacteria bacterium]|nr:rhodanese-like domain-containing protein [Campylobacterota bacterium]
MFKWLGKNTYRPSGRLTPKREDFLANDFYKERIVVDIRDKEDILEFGHIPNSVFIAYDADFVDNVKRLNAPVYVLCQRGVDSYEATLELQNANIDAINVNGGFFYVKEVLNVKVIKEGRDEIN